MTRNAKRSQRRTRRIKRLITCVAVFCGIIAGAIAYAVPFTALVMVLDFFDIRSGWVIAVATMPFLILFFYVAGQAGASLSLFFERIAGVEDDLMAFLRQVTYVDTGSDDGYWIDRSGRRYDDEAALMRGVDRFAKEREG